MLLQTPRIVLSQTKSDTYLTLSPNFATLFSLIINRILETQATDLPEETTLAKDLDETIHDHLKYVDGLDDILGKFYYLSDPGELKQGIEHWLVHTSEGRAWLDSLGFINKEAMIKVIEQIETNLEESNRELVTKIQMLRSYVDSKGNVPKEPL
ncbi:MAG: hypothetical protein HN842_06805 [Gammaproteobacteria bacterium]|nr:hypothetical protein [Gammaproteobacteria bacterium]